MHESFHIPVLLAEVLATLAPKTSKPCTFIDATLGYAGHSFAMLKAYQNLKLVASDKDSFALDMAYKKLQPFKDKISLHKCGFKDILDFAPNDLACILLDLGVSSYQLDCDNRGFANDSNFLDMRMDESAKLDAKYVVNEYSLNELERILRDFGELKDARELACKITAFRQKEKISSMKQLGQIIGPARVHKRKVSKLTLIAQAIRIEVNQELNELEVFLKKIMLLRPSGVRLGIISFHSLEDRMVKNAFRKWSKNCWCDADACRCTCGNQNAIGKIITKKPLCASKDEIKANSRSSCAKLRVFEFFQ